MKNTFSINYDKKTLKLNFEGEKFDWDLNEGDIGEFWHSFTNKQGVVRDISFHQEDENQEPTLSVYGLKYSQEEKSYFINTDDETVIELDEKIGNQKNYFKTNEIVEKTSDEEINDEVKSCNNCGSTNGYNNSSDEFQCDNCGYSETE